MLRFFLNCLGLNINWDIVLFSAPFADVTFFFSFLSTYFLINIVQATNSIKLKFNDVKYDVISD